MNKRTLQLLKMPVTNILILLQVNNHLFYFRNPINCNIVIFYFVGMMQEGPSAMGGVIITNQNNKPNNLNQLMEDSVVNVIDNNIIQQHEKDNAINGKLDINIKESPKLNKSDNNTKYWNQNEFKHNYH